RLPGVAAEGPGGSELSQLVAHHVFGDVDGDVLPPVVHRYGVPDHFRNDGGCPRPSLQHALLIPLIQFPDPFQQPGVDVRSLLKRPAHSGFLPQRFLRLRTMNLSEGLRRRRVLPPIAILPQGVEGTLPAGALPSPPPWGWSTGFMAAPRTVGRRPSQRLRPALPVVMFSCSGLLT